jgi:hypothetical protein
VAPAAARDERIAYLEAEEKKYAGEPRAAALHKQVQEELDLLRKERRAAKPLPLQLRDAEQLLARKQKALVRLQSEELPQREAAVVDAQRALAEASARQASLVAAVAAAGTEVQRLAGLQAGRGPGSGAKKAVAAPPPGADPTFESLLERLDAVYDSLDPSLREAYRGFRHKRDDPMGAEDEDAEEGLAATPAAAGSLAAAAVPAAAPATPVAAPAAASAGALAAAPAGAVPAAASDACMADLSEETIDFILPLLLETARSGGFTGTADTLRKGLARKRAQWGDLSGDD